MCKNKRTYTEEERKEMKYVRETQEDVCFYCKKPLTLGEIKKEKIISYIRDCATDKERLVISCEHCNLEGYNMDLQQYMKFLEVKFKAINDIPLEVEQLKLDNIEKELEEARRDYGVAKFQYEALLNTISCCSANEECYNKLQKLQLLIWEYKSNISKVNKLIETIDIQQAIVEMMKQQRDKIVSNATEQYKMMLGKLKVDSVQGALRKKLNLKRWLKYPNDTQKIVNIDSIIIKDNFLKTSPDNIKYNNIKESYKENKHIDKAVIIDNNNVLKDGYLRYLILKEYGIKEVPVKIA